MGEYAPHQPAIRWLALMRRYRKIMARVEADPAKLADGDEALRVTVGDPGADHFVQVFADKIPKTHGAPTRRPAMAESHA